MGEDLGVGQRYRARETSTSDAVACPLFSIRDVEMYDSVCLDPLCPSSTTLCLSFTLPHE